jgi:hypothetical protein
MAQETNPPVGGQQIQIKASDEMLKGAYANMAQIVHTPEEFVVDFMNILPPSGNLVSRIVVSPAHAKRIAQALMDNVKKFEEKFGAIKNSESPDHKIGFRTE